MAHGGFVVRRQRLEDCKLGDFVCAVRLPDWKLAQGSQPFRPEDLDPAMPSWAFERVTAEFYGGYVKAWARCS